MRSASIIKRTSACIIDFIILFFYIVVDKDGNRISYERAFLRSVFRFLSVLPFMAGYLLILNKEHRTLHDR